MWCGCISRGLRTLRSTSKRIVGATIAAAAVAGPALADATPVDVFDFRDQRDGVEIIYQARDLDLPQNVRDGLTQARDPASGLCSYL